jgi:hypothetical protein
MVNGFLTDYYSLTTIHFLIDFIVGTDVYEVDSFSGEFKNDS